MLVFIKPQLSSSHRKGWRCGISSRSFFLYPAPALKRVFCRAAPNNITNTAPVGDISQTGINNRGYRLVPTDTYSTFTNTTKGYEFEVTANFTFELP